MPCTLLRKSYFKAVETDVQLKVTDVPATEDDNPIGTPHDTVGTKVVNEFIDVQGRSICSYRITNTFYLPLIIRSCS